MVNSLEQNNNDLVQVDYTDLLEKILQALKNQNPFCLSEDGKRLLIDIDTVANQVATFPVQNPLTSSNGVRAATINFTPHFRESFPNKILAIRDCLKQLLSTPDFVARLATPLQSYQGNANQLGLSYAFNKSSPNLQKQKLNLQRHRPGSASLLKFHKIAIAVENTDQFHIQQRQALENYIDLVAEIESDRSDLHNILARMVADETSDFHRLQRVVDTETLGKLKKEAKIKYLEYLRDNIQTGDTIGLIYLQDLIRRLRIIETYISNEDKPDDDYEVNYAGAKVNYKDLFSRSEVLDALPIIPIVTGNLGESTDKNRGERQFIFGIKLKFGNAVQALGGDEVFDYNLNLLNPNSKEHKEELETNPNFGAKVLKLAFLYFFIFASRSNPDSPDYNPESELQYNPGSVFDAKVRPILQGSDEAAKKALFLKFLEGFEKYKAKFKIHRLRQLLKTFIDQQTILPKRTYPIQISVRKGILERDTDNIFNGIFFNKVLLRNPKECLRYISIGEAHMDENALCQLPGSITIEDIRYFATEESQVFRMEYDIKDIRALPVMWVPETCMKVYKTQFIQNNLILFRYNNRRLDSNNFDAVQTFVYKFTVSLLAYICLKILLDEVGNNLFIPMVRLHEGDSKNPSPSEKFMAHLSKALCHLLNEKHRASSQGFRIRNPNRFRISNGLSSLYSVLPKKFRFANPSDSPKLDKLAIIIVSSLESDARTGSKNRWNRISNLLGEVVGVTRQNDGNIRLEIIKTFYDNYPHRRLYCDPPILRDTVNNLYHQGYRHFLYIAQAPYTSTLNITQSDEERQLYFMSPKLIQELKGNRDDIKIYPVFFDKYYVRKAKNLNASSFYIEDTRELLNLAEDPSQSAVVFFNLFNGITVGKDRFYNGVISYSTLLNIYPGILDDKDIRLGLINDNSSLKNDILQYLTLFHFSRFEKDSNISLKLDPYENIIGEESFSKLSEFNHMRGEVNFNSLAFLSEVNKILNL